MNEKIYDRQILPAKHTSVIILVSDKIDLKVKSIVRNKDFKK